MKVIIIGGVAGGMSVATRLRRLNEQKLLFLKKDRLFRLQTADSRIMSPVRLVSVVNCLSKHLSLYKRFNLDVRPHHEVLSIDSHAEMVTVKHEDQTFTETYDHLILSPGAKPFVPPIEGIAEAKMLLVYEMFRI